MRTLIAPIVMRMLCLAVLILPSPVWADTLFVTNPYDDGPGSLRAAIGGAASGDTIQFHLSLPTQITLLSPLFVSGKTITIYGPGIPNLHISGDQSIPVFVNHGNLTISGVKIEHGNGLLGGCIFNGAGTLTLVDSWVYSCQGQLGGGILNIGTLNVINSKISNGVVGTGPNPGVGGGILNFGGTVTLTGSTVVDNFAVFADCYQGNVLRGCGGGGGIYNTSGGVVTLTNSKLLSNIAMDGGGLLNHSGSATLSNSTVADNQVYASGSGIENSGMGTLDVVGSTISGNLAYGQNFPYTVLDNTAPVPSGECDPDDPTDPDCVIIYLASTPSLTNGGAGLRNRGGAVLKNTTIADNSVTNLNGEPVGGGGILVNGQLFLSNVTLSGNKATCVVFGTNHCEGGGIFSAFAFIQIKNSILANQPDGGNCSINGGDFVSENNNLSDDATCAFSGAGDLNSVLAGFDPAGLADNGGPTKTVALLPTSPAVDAIPAADCTDLDDEIVAADQRGVLRPQGSGCDIGAYEYFASAFPLAALRTYVLIGTVNSLPLEQGTQNSLTAQLQAATDSTNKGKVKAAGAQLRAFINHTRALIRSGALTAPQGSMLLGEAEAVIQMIGG